MRILEKTFQDVRIDVRDGLEAIYANYVVARYSKDRFALDFVQIMPRARVHRVKARISMTPQDARLLATTLSAGRVDVDVRRAQNSRIAGRDDEMGRDRPGPPASDPGVLHLGDPGMDGQRAARRTLRPLVRLPSNLPATFSNVAIVSSTPAETVLEFACAAPGYYSLTISARIVLAEAGVCILQEALDGGLSAYDGQYGASCDVFGAESLPGVRTPATWGAWLPFGVN